MKKILFGTLIGFIVAGILGVGTMLLAQERRMQDLGSGPLVVLAGLRLKEEADIEGAEKLLKEQLIPAMTEMEGLKMKVLKRMKMPGEQTTDSGAYDYIMMAEIEKIQVFMQLMRSQDTGLSKFGDMMKEYAGHPYINPYTVIAKTE